MFCTYMRTLIHDDNSKKQFLKRTGTYRLLTEHGMYYPDCVLSRPQAGVIILPFRRFEPDFSENRTIRYPNATAVSLKLEGRGTILF